MTPIEAPFDPEPIGIRLGTMLACGTSGFAVGMLVFALLTRVA
jgi:hypothetical protein